MNNPEKITDECRDYNFVSESDIYRLTQPSHKEREKNNVLSFVYFYFGINGFQPFV